MERAWVWIGDAAPVPDEWDGLFAFGLAMRAASQIVAAPMALMS